MCSHFLELMCHDADEGLQLSTIANEMDEVESVEVSRLIVQAIWEMRVVVVSAKWTWCAQLWMVKMLIARQLRGLNDSLQRMDPDELCPFLGTGAVVHKLHEYQCAS